MTVKELKVLAKQQHIKGWYDMTKDELLKALNLNVEETNGKVQMESIPKVESNSELDKSKLEYIEKCEEGTLVAFRLPNGKVKTGKIAKRNKNNQKLKVGTEYGAIFVIDFKDVLWVKSNGRWPKGIYNLLKKKTVEKTI